MLSTEKFNREDTLIIKGLPKASIAYILILVIYFVPASFLFGLLGLLRDGYGYRATTLGFLIIFSLVTIWLLAKNYLSYKKDMAAQLKYCGSIRVLSKPAKRGYEDIYTDADDMKKITLPSKEVFDKIEVGDELYIEISKYSKEIFRMGKDGISLIKT